MRKAKHGDIVVVNYVGTFDDGTQFDSSQDRGPLEFVIGQGRVIRGFEKAVTGLSTGQSVKVRLTPAEAYGDYDDNLVFDMARSDLPQGLSVGQTTRLTMANGRILSAVVTGETGSTLTLDCNHPMAGKNLNFEITLVEIPHM